MEFRIADTFTDSLARLTGEEQKAVKTTALQKGGEKRRLTNTHPAVLKALDARTGKELYNSGTSISSWVHFTGLAVAEDKCT
jgi:hypothetical protein